MQEQPVYLGLRPFEARDSSFFFGRENDIKRVIDVLANHALVLLVGDSGAGKTSLLQAGVLPSLQGNAQDAFHLQLFIRVGSAPLFSLASAIAGSDAEAGRMYESLKVNAEYATAILLAKGCTSANKALLVVDPFEELYTISDRAEAAAFLNVILSLYSSSILALIISIRSEFVANLARDERFLRHFSQSMVVLGPPPALDLKRAIEQPAANFGVSFESGVVDRIINDIQASGDGQVNLPFLQVLLHSLWQHRHSDIITQLDYDSIGGTEGAMAAFLENTWQQFDHGDQVRLRSFVPRLVTPQGTRRLAAIEEFNVADRKLIDQLVNARLITVSSDHDNGNAFVELMHDHLVSALSRVAKKRDTEQQQRSSSLSRIAGTFGFKTLETQLERRTQEFQQTQADYDELMSQVAKLNERKAKLEKQFESLQMDIQKDTPKVFISYVHEDEKAARHLYQQLKKQGLQPWFDKEDIMSGEEWDRAIRIAIRQSDFIVICISSRTAVKRGYIQREIRLALECYEELPPGEAFLMPVRLEDCQVPEDLRKYQYTDLFLEDGFARLMKSILAYWSRRNRKSN